MCCCKWKLTPLTLWSFILHPFHLCLCYSSLSFYFSAISENREQGLNKVHDVANLLNHVWDLLVPRWETYVILYIQPCMSWKKSRIQMQFHQQWTLLGVFRITAVLMKPQNAGFFYMNAQPNHFLEFIWTVEMNQEVMSCDLGHSALVYSHIWSPLESFANLSQISDG